jgi:hypothetical protein
MKTLVAFMVTLSLLAGALTAARSVLASEAGVSLEGPDVTIIASKERVVYEYRQNGQLRMVRVVPNWGKPYTLVPADPTKGFGDLERAESLLPTWTLLEF